MPLVPAALSPASVATPQPTAAAAVNHHSAPAMEATNHQTALAEAPTTSPASAQSSAPVVRPLVSAEPTARTAVRDVRPAFHPLVSLVPNRPSMAAVAALTASPARALPTSMAIAAPNSAFVALTRRFALRWRGVNRHLETVRHRYEVRLFASGRCVYVKLDLGWSSCARNRWLVGT